ncbi:dihydroorotate dehydrogenase electron transfer subunit [Virgibacillus sp. JSM 102003]|uniref:dihydroorotate dehydrogenase electron transfer subunit n=1 Tax=Virgibacillus sp. JSM 102003 TaxID=1562108 RepID=UPI0035BF5B56
MKRKVELVVKSVHDIALETIEMTLMNEYVAKTAIPGQFLHLSIDGHTLRRPISIANTDDKNNEITILFKKVGDGTKQLAAHKPGMSIDALGPSGNGFSYDGNSNSVLLVGGGIGIPPLYNLGKTLRNEGINVTAVLGFQSKEYVFYESKFRELGKSYVVTNDGTYGHQGFVTSVMDQIEDFDTYYSCGPIQMLKAVTKLLHDHSGYISLEERMGCGVGACFACVIPTNNNGGYKKICKDGPVFTADEVIL